MILKITDIDTGESIEFDPVSDSLSALDDVQRSAVVSCLALGETVTVGHTICEKIGDYIPIAEWARREGISRQRAHVLANSGRIPSRMVKTARGKIRVVPSNVSRKEI